MLWNKEKYGDRVCILTFDDLGGKTEAVMRYLAEDTKQVYKEPVFIVGMSKFGITLIRQLFYEGPWL